MRVLVTGASGFVGGHLLPALSAACHEVIATGRSASGVKNGQWLLSPELGPGADWEPLLRGVEVVVHLAGRAHVPSETTGTDVEQLYHRINAEGSRALARQAAAAGVARFILLSSCHAVAAEADQQLTEETVPSPVTAYGRSKLAAEAGVRRELSGTGCAWTILRPPLAYGRGNKANFDRLAKLVRTGMPLPLGGVRNRRSFIYVENLASVIVAAINAPAARGRTYFPGDGQDVSTPELIKLLAEAAGTQARLFSLAPPLLRVLSALPGGGALGKLTASLFVDSGPVWRELEWTPPFTMPQGLTKLGL